MNRLTVLLMGCLLLASCFSGKHEPTEAELSAFGTYVNSLDSTLANCLVTDSTPQRSSFPRLLRISTWSIGSPSIP